MKNRQQGGTILGLILGLVVGLGIAVAVAIMVTKTSTPFTNKLGMAKPEMPAIQLTDPNKPLYGNAYKEPPPRPAGEKEREFDARNADASQETAENNEKYPEVESVPETVAKAVPEKNKATPKPESSTVAKEEKAALYLQVGAFRNQSDAENVRAKLALIDVESNVSTKTSEGDNLYRVRIGPFKNIDEMNRMRSKLVENSIDVAVIKTPK